MGSGAGIWKGLKNLYGNVLTYPGTFPFRVTACCDALNRFPRPPHFVMDDRLLSTTLS
jgi:hypothetical protein